MLTNIEYITPKTDSSSVHIKILRGEFTGVVYTLNRVHFPDANQPLLNFEYVIIEGKVDDVDRFKTFIGDELVKMIIEQLENKELVFAGGV